MAIKTMEVVVCDFKHKHDRPAVAMIQIDVCGQHAMMFADRKPDPMKCPHCGNTYTTQGGLNHHITVKHKGKKIKAVS